MNKLKNTLIVLFLIFVVHGCTMPEFRTAPPPEPPPAEVTRMEYDMKDQLIRQTIMTTQDDVKEIKEDMKRIEEKLDRLR